MDDVEVAAWVSGLIDAEGCVYSHSWVDKRGQVKRSRVVKVGVTDVEIAEFYMECLSRLKIPYSYNVRPGKLSHYRAVHHVDVQSARGLRRLNQVCILRCISKREDLATIVGSYSDFRDGCVRCRCSYITSTPGCPSCRRRLSQRARDAARRSRTIETADTLGE